MGKVALICGATGIVGKHLVDILSECSTGPWKVYGLARRAAAKGQNEEENCSMNSQMFSNALDALMPKATNLEHVFLQTGAKHYLRPSSAVVERHETPFRETPVQKRLLGPGGYSLQALEAASGPSDLLHSQTGKGFSAWNFMNLLGSLRVWCHLQARGSSVRVPWTPLHTGRYTTTQDAKNQAYNITNGDVFKWKRLWLLLAEELGLEAAPYPGKPLSLTDNFSGKDEVWNTIVKEEGLLQTRLKDVGHFWFADYILNVQFENVSSVNKSKEFGFHGFRNTEKSSKSIINEIIEAKLIPSFQGRYQLRNGAKVN